MTDLKSLKCYKIHKIKVAFLDIVFAWLQIFPFKCLRKYQLCSHNNFTKLWSQFGLRHFQPFSSLFRKVIIASNPYLVNWKGKNKLTFNQRQWKSPSFFNIISYTVPFIALLYHFNVVTRIKGLPNECN